MLLINDTIRSELTQFYIFGDTLATYPHAGPPSTGGCPCGLGHAFEPIGELMIDPSPSSDRYPPGELN